MTGTRGAEDAKLAKKLFIKTYGCQMNVYDSDRMADVMAVGGYDRADAPDDADLIILNTCHIREKAAEKVYSELGRLKPLKDAANAAGRRMLIAVGGCVAQAEGQEMLRRAPFLDVVFGPQTYHRLGGMIREAESGRRVVDTDFPTDAKFDFLPTGPAPGLAADDPVTGGAGGPGKMAGIRNSAAFLSVQEGCDKFCTFCVVPYTRGAEYSRPAADLLGEARRLVAGGAVEITLLGQNVNAYHGVGPGGREWGLGRLIRELADIDGLKRIRYTTSHPRDMDDELILAHRDVPALMPYLHLPVQSGSDSILEAMNRGYTAADYLAIVDRLRAARPDLALTSDFIVGFPGESAADFERTLDLVRNVGYAHAYSFKYSARPGTPAAAAEDDDPVAEAEKTSRLAALQSLIAEQSTAFNAACVGTVMDILFDRPGRYPGQVAGRSPYLQAVHVPAPGDDPDAIFGTIRPVRIVQGLPNSLSGTLEAPCVPASRSPTGSSHESEPVGSA